MQTKTIVKDKYLKRIINDLKDFCSNKDVQCFIFGSSLIKKRFADIDIALKGTISEKDIFYLKEYFNESTIPYSVDIVNFDKVSKEFRDNVFNQKILWVKR